MPWFTSERPERGYFNALGYRFNTSQRWWGTAITSVTGPHPFKWWKRITVWESRTSRRSGRA